MKPPVVLETFDLCKIYGPVQALNHVSLCVNKGEIFGFLGPNGAGKTTTIGILLGLIYPTSGKVEIFGQRVTPLNNRILGQTSAIFGSPGFLPYLTGRQNLSNLACARRVDHERIKTLLEQVGLSEAGERKVKGYSLGMKQRLALAAALLHEPELLILDEPTNGLDPVYIREFRDLLRSLAQAGMTVFLSSHLLHEVEQICDRVAVLNQGRMLYQGEVKQLLENQKFVRIYVSQLPETIKILKNCPHIQAISGNGNYVDVQGIPSQDMVALLAKNGIYPREVVIHRHDLEDTFLELIEEPRSPLSPP